MNTNLKGNASNQNSEALKTESFRMTTQLSAVQRRKRFGQVFTPPTVAALMADWVMGCRPDEVLDPAFGRGALAIACLDRDPEVNLFGYEVDPVVLDEATGRAMKATRVQLEDFLKIPTSKKFDAIIANPPYIRHRELDGHLRQRDALSIESGCMIPKSANLYIDFLVKATLHLKKGGRASFLIPAEWMSANFSSNVKKFLLDENLLHSLVTFSNCSSVFGNALTTASLLFLEKTEEKIEEITSYFLQSFDASRAPYSLAMLDLACEAKRIPKASLRVAPKWEPILRGDPSTLPQGWTTLGELATTRRGIATGANSFFLISEAHRAEAKIEKAHALPCIGHSNDVRGLVFTDADFDYLKRKHAKIWLLNFSLNLSNDEATYVNSGEVKGFHKRFLTKTRKVWFTMEQRTPAPIWAGVFGRGDLRFIHNRAGARSLTNFHCVYPTIKCPDFARALVAVLNSRAVRDLMVSHQRGYGGGLMKFEPKDLLMIPIPDLRRFSKQAIEELGNQLQDMHNLQSDGFDPSSEKVEAIIRDEQRPFQEERFRLIG